MCTATTLFCSLPSLLWRTTPTSHPANLFPSCLPTVSSEARLILLKCRPDRITSHSLAQNLLMALPFSKNKRHVSYKETLSQSVSLLHSDRLVPALGLPSFHS